MKNELELSNYQRKADLENSTGTDTSKFAKRIDFTNLKFKSSIVLIQNWIHG